MVRRLCCLLVLILTTVTGCGDGGSEVSAKQFALLGELRDALAKVKDAASLQTERPAIEKITQQLAATQAELNKQQITTEQARDLRAKYGKDLEKLQKELEDQAKRLDALPEVNVKDLVSGITAATAGMTP